MYKLIKDSDLSIYLIYSSEIVNGFYYFDHKQKRPSYNAKFIQPKKDSKTIMIADGDEKYGAMFADCSVILITSPRKCHYKSFIKYSNYQFCMPLWSLKEIQTFKQRVYS